MHPGTRALGLSQDRFAGGEAGLPQSKCRRVSIAPQGCGPDVTRSVRKEERANSSRSDYREIARCAPPRDTAARVRTGSRSATPLLKRSRAESDEHTRGDSGYDGSCAQPASRSGASFPEAPTWDGPSGDAGRNPAAVQRAASRQHAVLAARRILGGGAGEVLSLSHRVSPRWCCAPNRRGCRLADAVPRSQRR